MLTIAQLAFASSGKAGSNASWSAETHETPDGVVVRTIRHYGHLMLQFRVDNPRDPNYLFYSTGWGSVSDQGGMNRLFRVLNIPRYFSRAGGSSIDACAPFEPHVV
jgi:hypothetical protein